MNKGIVIQIRLQSQESADSPSGTEVLNGSSSELRKRSNEYRVCRLSSVSSWKQSIKSILYSNGWPFELGTDCPASTGIVQSSTGSNYVVRILSTLDREKLKPSSSVALHRHSNSLVDILPPEADSSIAMLGAHEKPDVTYADVGGLDMQKQEIREAVELPLTHFDLYKQIGYTSGLTNWPS